MDFYPTTITGLRCAAAAGLSLFRLAASAQLGLSRRDWSYRIGLVTGRRVAWRGGGDVDNIMSFIHSFIHSLIQSSIVNATSLPHQTHHTFSF